MVTRVIVIVILIAYLHGNKGIGLTIGEIQVIIAWLLNRLLNHLVVSFGDIVFERQVSKKVEARMQASLILKGSVVF